MSRLIRISAFLVLVLGVPGSAWGDVWDQLKKAEELHKSRAYEQAEELYREIAEGHKQSEPGLDARKNLTGMYVDWGKVTEAQAGYEALVGEYAEHKGLDWAVLHVADKYRQSERCGSAIKLYDYIIGRWPRSDSALWSQTNLAICRAAFKDGEAAQVAIEKLRTDFAGHKTLPKAILLIGDDYRKSKKYSEARKLYEQVVNGWDKSEEAMWAQMGIAISKSLLGDEAGAAAARDKLRSGFSGQAQFSSAVFQTGEAYYYEGYSQLKYGRQAVAEGCFRSAVALWEPLIKGKPESEDTLRAYFYSAELYARLGREEKAVAYYRIVVDKWPGASRSPLALHRIIRLYDQSAQSGSMAPLAAAVRIRQAGEQYCSDYPNASGIRDAQRIVKHWKFVYAWLASGSAPTAQGPWEPSDAEVQLARETMERLRAEYPRFFEAAAEFVEATEDAKREEPRLAALEACLKRIADATRGSQPGETEYYQLRNRRPEYARKMFARCRGVFGAKALAEALADPNQAWELKPALILEFRSMWSREDIADSCQEWGLEEFDPKDSDEERLWENIKGYMAERSKQLEPVRRKMIEVEGIPESLAEYAGKYDYVQPIFEWSKSGMHGYCPKRVIEAQKQFKDARRRMEDIYPMWRLSMLGLLGDYDIGEAQAIINAAYDKRGSWPE